MSDLVGGPPEPEPYPSPPSDPPPTGYGPAGQWGYPNPAAYPPPALKPGVVPLRPLTLGEIFNGAIACIRSNPKATLGLTAAVVVTAQVLTVVLQIAPLTVFGGSHPNLLGSPNTAASGGGLVGSIVSTVASLATTIVSSIVLNGLLTVVVGRAVFGASISPGEAWRRVRGRILPLLGLTALEILVLVALIAAGIAGSLGMATFVSPLAAFFTGMMALLVGVAAVAYVTASLAFAPAAIVLERLSVTNAIERSFRLVRKDFWRVFGIGLLAVIIAGIISAAVSSPFAIGGQVLRYLQPSTANLVLALVLTAVGGAIGRIVTAPFSSGVVVLLYADQRMRAEAFDLVLQTGVGAPATGDANSTDDLWLTARR